VVPRDSQYGRSQPREESPSLRQLLRPAPMRQIPCRDDKLRAKLRDKLAQCVHDIERSVAPDMEVRDMDQRQGGTRLSSLRTPQSAFENDTRPRSPRNGGSAAASSLVERAALHSAHNFARW
jgi:hypothetical protein